MRVQPQGFEWVSAKLRECGRLLKVVEHEGSNAFASVSDSA